MGSGMVVLVPGNIIKLAPEVGKQTMEGERPFGKKLLKFKILLAGLLVLLHNFLILLLRHGFATSLIS